MTRPITFKTSVAAYLMGVDPSPKASKGLLKLIGREKPAGQHHMRYTPSDMRAAQYRKAGMEPPAAEQPLFPEARTVPIIVTRMTKGGVGKTSISVNVAAAMAMMGYRVLVIDADPQASATNLLGVSTTDYDTEIPHIGEYLIRASDQPDKDLPSAIRHIYDDGFLDLIAADISLSGTDAALIAVMGSHARADLFLKRNAAFLSANYDVVIVDTAPGTTPIGLAFSYAARNGRVLTVVEPEGSCLRALDSLMSNLNELDVVVEAKIGMVIVVNKWHSTLKHVNEGMSFLWTNYGTMMDETIVPSYSGFAKQFDSKTNLAAPLVEIEPISSGARAIYDLAKSLITKFGVTLPGLKVQG